jgi:polyferredoxin
MRRVFLVLGIISVLITLVWVGVGFSAYFFGVPYVERITNGDIITWASVAFASFGVTMFFFRHAFARR